jgi:hypothetical protein
MGFIDIAGFLLLFNCYRAVVGMAVLKRDQMKLC